MTCAKMVWKFLQGILGIVVESCTIGTRRPAKLISKGYQEGI